MNVIKLSTGLYNCGMLELTQFQLGGWAVCTKANKQWTESHNYDHGFQNTYDKKTGHVYAYLHFLLEKEGRVLYREISYEQITLKS